MRSKKIRTKVEVKKRDALHLAKTWFGKDIPDEILVRYNPRQIVHAHSYGGLSPFFAGISKYKIIPGTYCGQCFDLAGSQIWLPPRVHCPDCYSKMIWIVINPKGAEVYTYSTTNYPGANFKVSVPCPLISIEIPGVCTKFMSYLSKFGEGEPYIGMPVKPVFRTKNPTYTILDLSWVPYEN